MTNSTLKKYSYGDFKLKFESDRFKQTELSVCESYNVDFSNGTIKPLSDFKEIFSSILNLDEYNTFLSNVGDEINNLTYYTEYSFYSESDNIYKTRTFVINNKNELYEFDRENLYFKKLSITFKSNQITTFERNKLFYFVCANSMMIYFRQESPAVFVLGFTDTLDSENYQDCLVFTVRNKNYEIYYSTNKNLDDITFDTSYFSEFELESKHGEILALKKFGSGLYAIQQYAISKLTISSGELKISAVTPISSKIVRNSLYILKDNIIFCTAKGICLFDGLNLKTYFEDEFHNINDSYNSFCVYNENYYITYNKNGYKLLAELNIQNESLSLYNIGNVINVYTIKNALSYKLIACVKEKDVLKFYELDLKNGSTYTKYIKFNKITFDNSISKILSSIQIFTKKGFLLKITSDYATKEITVNGYTFLRNIGLQGNYFQFEIMSDENFEIESMMFSLETYSEKL